MALHKSITNDGVRGSGRALLSGRRRLACRCGRRRLGSVRFRRKDDGAIWVSIFISPVRDDTGAVVQHFASFVDITRHERERERLRSLLDELNHRTQNTLATVLPIAGQTLRSMADEQTIDAFEGRILALSRTHILLGAEDWDRIGLREILYRTLERLEVDAGVGSGSV